MSEALEITNPTQHHSNWPTPDNNEGGEKSPVI